MELRMCIPCLFGLEGLLADELRRLGMEEVNAENGRVFFSGDERDMARANLWIRTGERVLVLVGEFEARSFDGLFEGTKALRWEDYIPADGHFPVRGHCLESQLMSVPDCRSIIKKAVADRLGRRYGVLRMPEDGAKYQIRFSVMRDRVQLFIDSSGQGLHKRGYRALSNDAPLRETLAAGIVMLSRYRGKGPFADPFCGSGTIPIEAALIAKNRAPGLCRSFDFERWEMSAGILPEVRKEAREKEFDNGYDIWGGDTDPAAVELARQNAEKAGVGKLVRFELADARRFSSGLSRGTIAANPPYGVRLSDARSVQLLCRDFGAAVAKLDGWGVNVLSADPEFERNFGRKADKKRKLYNGMLKCDLYMYR